MASKSKPKSAPEADVALVATHDYVKLFVVTHFVDADLGEPIFPHQSAGSAATTPVLIALEKVMDVTAVFDISWLLNRRITVGSNSVSVHTYMDKASCLLHDSLLSKISNAFFCGLPSDSPLSNNSRAAPSRRQDFAREVDERHDYYRSSKYAN